MARKYGGGMKGGKSAGGKFGFDPGLKAAPGKTANSVRNHSHSGGKKSGDTHSNNPEGGSRAVNKNAGYA